MVNISFRFNSFYAYRKVILVYIVKNQSKIWWWNFLIFCFIPFISSDEQIKRVDWLEFFKNKMLTVVPNKKKQQTIIKKPPVPFFSVIKI